MGKYKVEINSEFPKITESSDYTEQIDYLLTKEYVFIVVEDNKLIIDEKYNFLFREGISDEEFTITKEDLYKGNNAMKIAIYKIAIFNNLETINIYVAGFPEKPIKLIRV